MNYLRLVCCAALLLTSCVCPKRCAHEKGFVGAWALHPPGGRAGWLGVSSNQDGIKAEMMWIAGSVNPLETAKIADGKLLLTRSKEVDGPSFNGKPSKIKLVENITVELNGDTLKGTSVTPKANGNGENRIEFTGNRLPKLPPAPDMSKVKFGPEIQLFNGTNLDGWRLNETNEVNGWGARDGFLFNDVTQEAGKPKKHFGNLRTEREFEDFALHVEARPQTNENSGVYLRGLYEVQIFDTYGKPLDSHNMGAIYSRIKPLVSAEKPAGEWQTLDITMVQRHVTVILNGKTIIENQPLLGPTGGAIRSEVDLPGPILLQGDHTGIEYRNLVLRPVISR